MEEAESMRKGRRSSGEERSLLSCFVVFLPHSKSQAKMDENEDGEI
jgi:hypothetical protein